MNGYRETSMVAYASIIDSLGDRHKAVIRAMNQLSEATNLGLSRFLNWEINKVTPRVNELVKKGLIKESKVDKDPLTGRQSTFWKLANRDEIKILKI